MTDITGTINWTTREYPFGTGAVTVYRGKTWELVPFVSPSGTGQVAGYALQRDGQRSGWLRLVGLDLDQSRVEAGWLIEPEPASVSRPTPSPAPAPVTPPTRLTQTKRQAALFDWTDT